MKEKTMRAFLLSQKHIVYTEPLEVRAGTTVDVLYNPSNTVLNGKSEVWFRGSFNRWTHPSGPLPPQKMVKAENSSHLRTTGVQKIQHIATFSWTNFYIINITIYQVFLGGLQKYFFTLSYLCNLSCMVELVGIFWYWICLYKSRV